MVGGQNLGGLLDTSNTNQPTGTLGRQEEAGQGNEGKDNLKDDGDTPAPVRGNVTAGKGDPTAEGATKVPADHEQSVGDRSLLWVGDLVDQERGRVSEPRGGDTDEETGVGECRFVLSCRLHDDTENQEQVSDVDARLTTPTVGAHGGDGEGDTVSEPVDTCDPTKVCAGGVVRKGVPSR